MCSRLMDDESFVPLFFIDTDDGDLRLYDEHGTEFAGMRAARYAALAALPDMTRMKLPDGDRRVFAVAVRNEAGAIVYTASLTLVGEWLIEPPPE